jgi:hypothetical protein
MEKANPVSAGSVDCNFGGLNSLWEAQNTIFGGDGCRRKIQKHSRLSRNNAEIRRRWRQVEKPVSGGIFRVFSDAYFCVCC